MARSKKPSNARKTKRSSTLVIKRQHFDWDADTCIARLVQLQKAHPDVRISRTLFRNQGIADSTWDCHFGTFHEFRRQASTELTRQQHQLEQHIAKHVSVDHYREFNIARQDWGLKYIRKNKTRFQTVLAMSDLHDINCDPFTLDVIIDTAKRVKPDVIALVGDIFDLAEFGNYKVDPRDWDVVGHIKAAHKILERLRKACSSAHIVFIEGNHEFRLLRHLADATPALRTVLSDLHGMTIPGLLGLDKYQINYIAKADLAAYRETDIKKEINKNEILLFECLLLRHHPLRQQDVATPGVNGHNHKLLIKSFYNHVFGSFNWLQLPAGHVMDASFCNGEAWQNGFSLIHVDTVKKFVQFEPIITSFDSCVVGGKFYYRKDSK